MRADENVDFASLYALQNLLLLLRRTEAANHFNGHRECSETLLEGLKMLKRQHCRRRKHRNLLVVADRLESRAHSDFGLAIPNIPAQQSIHWQLRFHVA